MNVSPYYEQAIRSYSAEDKAFFDRATAGLPKRKETTPYHSEAHSVRSLRMAYELAGRPANVLEIGFNLGHSAALWFALGATRVSSVEISDREETLQATHYMPRFYPLEFRFVRPWDEKPFLKTHPPGLIFIDGDHSVEGVDADTKWALELGIPYILYDDFYPNWGPGTQPAIERYKLVPLAILGTMCLCRPAYDL